MIKKNIYIITLTIIASLLLYSCEKVVYLDLNSADTRIVIEGNITPNQGPYEVMITTSGDYYTGEGIMPIKDAQVIINDDFGNIDTLTEKSDGVYFTNYLVGESDRMYSLQVIHNDNNYSGSEFLPREVPIDSVSYQEIPKNSGPPPEFPENKVYNLFCYFTDAEETENYYRFTVLINGEEYNGRSGRSGYNVTDDQLFNGQHIKYTIWYVEAGPQDTVTVLLDAIGFNTYEYFRTINDAVGSGGMGGTPYNPITNLSNNALGYFGAYARFSSSAIIRETPD